MKKKTSQDGLWSASGARQTAAIPSTPEKRDERNEDSERIVICEKDLSGRVVHQNKACIGVCNHREGEVCKGGCMEYFAALMKTSVAEKSALLLPAREIRNAYYDIVFFRGDDRLTTVMHRVKGVLSEKLPTLGEFKLTEREYEIAKLMLRGHANQEICKLLFISRPTLKTHVNRIYRKCGSRKNLFPKR
ncbi:MAG: response regulator transcription factor [Deltaproteobacteria bacterium]|nr:response regulator transcription factor [Deltaproteobacteria bacterium]